MTVLGFRVIRIELAPRYHLAFAVAALRCAPAFAEPARIDDACSYKGVGFVQVPGTATCVKVAGRAVAEAGAGTGGTRTRTGGTVRWNGEDVTGVRADRLTRRGLNPNRRRV